MTRFAASALIALLAGMVAHDAGLPFWRDFEPGDVCDIATTTFWAVFALIGALRTTGHREQHPAW
jgi:hypothetical protein